MAGALHVEKHLQEQLSDHLYFDLENEGQVHGVQRLQWVHSIANQHR